MFLNITYKIGEKIKFDIEGDRIMLFSSLKVVDVDATDPKSYSDNDKQNVLSLSVPLGGTDPFRPGRGADGTRLLDLDAGRVWYATVVGRSRCPARTAPSPVASTPSGTSVVSRPG